MTVTLKPWMAALTIATISVLAGFSISQITAAKSERATTSATSVQDRAAVTQLKEINKKLGAPGISGTVLSQLHQVIGNTYATCDEVSFSSFCSYRD
jgi:hypothetical protein